MSLRTAGVFVLIDGRIAFQAGPDQTGEQIGLVRIGGHIGPGETPWDCACREALEEASLTVDPVDAPATYCLDTEVPRSVDWLGESPQPIHASATSHIFLGVSEDTPHPASETRAIILMSPSDLISVSRTAHTLESLESRGCTISLRDPAERDRLFTLPVGPRWAARLAAVMTSHPDLSLWALSSD